MRKLLATSLVALSTLGAGCGTTIEAGELGLKLISLDEPALQKEARPEGFYFQWPWNDIVIYDVTWRSRDEDVEVLTADDLHVPTTVTVTFRPKPDRLYELHTKIGQEFYEAVIQPAFVTLARTAFAEHKHNDLARNSGRTEARILEQLRQALAEEPVDISQVAIKHIMYDRLVTTSISEKLAMEQKSQQKEFELQVATHDAEIARTAAKGKADSAAIRAEGDAKAIVLRGAAQAEAQEAIGKTLTASYIQYKAFEGSATRYYFVPVGKDGLPLIINAEPSPAPGR